MRIAPLALAAGLLGLALPAGAQGGPTPPPPGPVRPFQMPQAQEFTLANGLRVVVVRKPGVPIVSARMTVRAGAIYEPAAKAGLAGLTGRLLDQGVPGLTGSQIAARFERLGAQVSTSAGAHTALVDAVALTRDFPQVFALAARLLTEPTFPENEFTRIRSQMIAQTAQRVSTVEGLAAETFARAIYTPESPYARHAGGYRPTLESITLADVKDWYARAYAPAGTTLLLVGDITAAQARTLAQRVLGGWQARGAALPTARSAALPVPGTRVILVDRPGSVQSGLWVGQASIGYGDSLYLPLAALSEVLGGGFKARVNMNLRERRGWTYGAFSTFVPRAGVGHLAVTSAVRTNATDSAVAEVVREWRRIATEPVPAEELQATVNNVVGSFPSSLQTVQALSSRLETLLIYGLPLDFWTRYRQGFAGVRAADIARAARDRVNPEALTVVVAGDLSKIEQPIRDLGLGTVEVWDAMGNKVR